MILFTFSQKILAYELKETYNDFVKVIYNVWKLWKGVTNEKNN